MRIALWTVVVVALAGCTIKKGSGKGGDIALKVDKVEHPLTIAQTTFRGNGYDLVVERVFLVEERTIFGPQNWRAWMHGTVVNTSGTRILFDELSGKFSVVGRSGKIYQAYPGTRGSRGKTGWLLQEHTQEPTHLPAGARGLIEVFSGLDGKDSADAPVAFTFSDQRAQVR
jgi:hypothetical protein